MASKNKKDKTDRKKHPGKGGMFLKQKGPGIKRVSFYNGSQRKEDKKPITKGIQEEHEDFLNSIED
jgi:hypothetical protein